MAVNVFLIRAHAACQKLIENREVRKVFDANQYELVLSLMAEAWLAGGTALAHDVRSDMSKVAL